MLISTLLPPLSSPYLSPPPSPLPQPKENVFFTLGVVIAINLSFMQPVVPLCSHWIQNHFFHVINQPPPNKKRADNYYYPKVFLLILTDAQDGDENKIDYQFPQSGLHMCLRVCIGVFSLTCTPQTYQSVRKSIIIWNIFLLCQKAPVHLLPTT